jgi:hypothetical protein
MPAFPLDDDGYPSHVTIKPTAEAEFPEAEQLTKRVSQLRHAQSVLDQRKGEVEAAMEALQLAERDVENVRMAVREAADALDLALRDLDPKVLPADRPMPNRSGG